MSDTPRYRRENFQSIFRAKELKQKEFAELSGLKASHVSQILAGVRNPGEGVCRRIESSLGLPFGWMDEHHSTGIAYLERFFKDRVPIPTEEQLFDTGPRQPVPNGVIGKAKAVVKALSTPHVDDPSRRAEFMQAHRAQQEHLYDLLKDLVVPGSMDIEGRVATKLGLIRCDAVIHSEPKLCIDIINVYQRLFSIRKTEVYSQALALKLAERPVHYVTLFVLDTDSEKIKIDLTKMADTLKSAGFLYDYVFDFDDLRRFI